MSSCYPGSTIPQVLQVASTQRGKSEGVSEPSGRKRKGKGKSGHGPGRPPHIVPDGRSGALPLQRLSWAARVRGRGRRPLRAQDIRVIAVVSTRREEIKGYRRHSEDEENEKAEAWARLRATTARRLGRHLVPGRPCHTGRVNAARNNRKAISKTPGRRKTEKKTRRGSSTTTAPPFRTVAPSSAS